MIEPLTGLIGVGFILWSGAAVLLISEAGLAVRRGRHRKAARLRLTALFLPLAAPIWVVVGVVRLARHGLGWLYNEFRTAFGREGRGYV